MYVRLHSYFAHLCALVVSVVLLCPRREYHTVPMIQHLGTTLGSPRLCVSRYIPSETKALQLALVGFARANCIFHPTLRLAACAEGHSCLWWATSAWFFGDLGKAVYTNYICRLMCSMSMPEKVGAGKRTR